eukprot:COSAG01_NODE_14867_length_1401_cov_1.049923_1_plen_355_part_00
MSHILCFTNVQVAARITSTTRTVAELQTVVATLAEAAVHLPDRQQELAEIAAHVGRELRVAGRHMRIVQRIEGGFDLTPPQVEDGVDIDPELLHVKSGRIVGDGTMLHTGQSKSSRLRSLWARDDSTQKSVDVETAEKPALDTPPTDDATKIALEPRKPAIRRTGTRASIFGEFVADGNTGGRASGGALDSLAVEANESTRIVEPVNETAKARALELKRRNAALRRAAAIARVTATAQARTRRLILSIHRRAPQNRAPPTTAAKVETAPCGHSRQVRTWKYPAAQALHRIPVWCPVHRPAAQRLLTAHSYTTSERGSGRHQPSLRCSSIEAFDAVHATQSSALGHVAHEEFSET